MRYGYKIPKLPQFHARAPYRNGMTLRTKKYWARQPARDINRGMMHWETKLAERTRWFRRNTVREFLKYAGQPGIISFAGGLPDSALLPVDQARAATDRVLARIGAKALQYGPSEGIPEL